MFRNKHHVYGPEAAEVPVHLHFGRFLLRKIWSHGDSIAVISADTGETLTYREFAQQAVDVALSLVKRGVSVGQCVSICSEKRLEFLPVVLGIICSGATFTPADIDYRNATLLHRMNIAKPTTMFCSPAAWETHQKTLQEVDSLHTFIVFGEQVEVEGSISFKQFLTEHGPVADFLATPVEGWKDLAMIAFSSGTTGLPKGIPLTHLNLINMFNSLGDPIVYKGKCLLNTREWYYTYGLCYTLSCVCAGIVTTYSLRNSIEDMLAAIEKYKVNAIQLAPSTIVELVKSDLLPQYDISSLEYMVSSSTPADEKLINHAKTKFPNLRAVYQMYGMTEAGASCFEGHSTKGPKPGSVGQPTAGTVVKVVDPTTREPLGPRQQGEICIKSPSLFPGYMDDPSREHLDGEGFILTGDIGYYDEDGYFFILDRIKELIKSNSFQVAPAELEAVLQLHPLVREAGVVGAPHDAFGEVPLAFVVLRPRAAISEDELIAFVNTQISKVMQLWGGVRFVDALPRGAGDKLDRKALKLML